MAEHWHGYQIEKSETVSNENLNINGAEKDVIIEDSKEKGEVEIIEPDETESEEKVENEEFGVDSEDEMQELEVK